MLLKSSLRKAAIAWIVANQLGRRHLTPSQKGPLGMELEKQLAEAAKLRRRATPNNNAGKLWWQNCHHRSKAKPATLVITAGDAPR